MVSGPCWALEEQDRGCNVAPDNPVDFVLERWNDVQQFLLAAAVSGNVADFSTVASAADVVYAVHEHISSAFVLSDIHRITQFLWIISFGLFFEFLYY